MATADIGLLFLVICFFYTRVDVISSLTHHGDAAALQTLKSSWENTPANWNQSNDPCGLPWTGVTCTNSRVTTLELIHLGLKGKLSPAIGDLTELTSLFLSENGFTGSIPDELGNLAHLSCLDLGTNNLTGKIPASLGNLTKLASIFLAGNQLSGPLPVSTGDTPGLDLLVNAYGFYFENNKLSGSIPSKLFSSNMVLQHLDFHNNQLNGKIPDTLGLVQTLKFVVMDQNALSGAIPSSISNLTNLFSLDLAQNRLSRSLPDLSNMTSLRYLDLSNNSFDAVEAPTWLSTLPSLIDLSMENGSLQGPVPMKLLSLPRIRWVKLRNNAFNGTLTIDGISSQLRLVDLENNQISSVTFGLNSTTLMLMGNPICANTLSSSSYCHKAQSTTP